MKEELSIEEKALRYDEAIERAREWSETKNGYYMPKELCEEIFPELKESEGERIVKCLLNYFNHVRYNGIDLKGTDVDEVIAWLKSLKERYTWKPSDEQMAALNDINLTGGISYLGQGQELVNLYNDLKKIKGE